MIKIFTLLFCISVSALLAQPTLNSTIFPVVGSSLNFIPVNPAALSPGAGGANQTWNFTGVVASGPAESVSYVTPASTPYAANHAGSTIASPIPDGSGGFIYTYYSHNTTESLLRGLTFTAAGQPVHFTYSNPEKMMQYPFTYNSNFSDTYSASYTFVQPGLTIILYRNGVTTALADGYGTLQVPGSTYSNVLRVKTRQVLVDSTVYVGVPIAPIVSNYSSTTHNWFSGTLINKLNQFTLSFDTTTSVGNPPSYNAYARYQTATTGLNENTVNLHTNVYPNPAMETTHLEINNAEVGEAVLLITDINGRKVNEIKLNFINPDNNNILIDLTDYSKGIYNLQVIQQKQIWTSKVVKL